MENGSLQKGFQKALKALYGVLKNSNQYIQFACRE